MADEKVVDPCRQNKLPLQIVVSSKPLEVAKAWVRNMTGGADSDSDLEDSPTKELESRPPRLGLGAKYIPHSQAAATINPVERKLRTMTNTGKHRAGERTSNLLRSRYSRKESKPDTSSESSDEDEEEEVKGSRNGRPQRRIGSADLLTKSVSSKDRKRKR